MSTQYVRVVKGDRLSDEDPLLESGGRSIPFAPATYNPSWYPPQPAPQPQPQPQPHLYPYGTYSAPPPPGFVIVETEPGEECALLGCIFSWIPVVGIATYLANIDALPHTRRAFWSRWALITSLIIFLAVIVFGPLYYW
jgi:hypothetical protein